jgi:hypothetical protein
MTTTENPATPLPFLLPAANLALNDVIPGGTIALLRAGRHGVNVEFADGTSKVFRPDELIEVTRRSPAAALNDVVTALTELAEAWDLREKFGEGTGDRTYGICSTELRATLARLQP